MRLELRQTAGEGSSKGWFFERGKRTLGRSPDCDWQVSDPKRLISKIHCAIERDRAGFFVRDQSANGTRVDGATIFEGETARLTDKSKIAFGDVAFTVVITGEADREMDDPAADLRLSDERLTISSILADIAPGGGTATGVLGQRNGDDWIAGLAQSSKNGKSPSRNVDIGWNGPPDVNGIKPILPDDWNSDFELGSQLEHGAATHVSVAVARDSGSETVETAKTIIPANDMRAADNTDQGLDDASFALQFDPLRQLEALVSTLEQTLDDEASIFGIEDSRAGASTSLFSRERTEQLADRLRSLISRQSTLNAGLENLVREANRMFEPRMIEAHVDASQRKALWRGNGDYWKAYRAQFERGGRSISVRDLLAEAFSAHAHGRDEDDTASLAERTGNTR
ncbi:FHA domain protein [Rhizobium sp. ERR 922]|uniref:FHA domain-containing protein n=1 Tax=Rhizobium TaxID=379 RepID=UPI000DDE0072|nr:MULTISPECIES: FHA domain-containing protein [Rhizobium]MCZ3374445.1 FHA domain-containing protein [Rhizobium sp. AG207R]TWB09235.1 FHA domain protein [Rhizobium sp. ERR1071]TWB49083.1 FHA domain protein [Rhizobium sp. ERR 922]TWB91615.1 FHA domain protein [Rhizobium sp. ERR 942]GES41697.1 forkhead-associated protein [Rhizobium dioscoreae]